MILVEEEEDEANWLNALFWKVLFAFTLSLLFFHEFNRCCCNCKDNQISPEELLTSYTGPSHIETGNNEKETGELNFGYLVPHFLSVIDVTDISGKIPHSRFF